MAYGADSWTARLHERVADVFERDDVAVFPVASGTAANALGLAALCPPWGVVSATKRRTSLSARAGQRPCSRAR